MYANFASVYDRLMQDVPYSEWINYLQELFKTHGISPAEILDIGCGTGNVTLPLAAMGYKLTGLDLSPEMLAVAESKAREKRLDIRWIMQDMREINLGEHRYDLVISMTDSLNYIADVDELASVFHSVKNHLKPGGWFVFDLNTLYKISEVFGSNTYTLLDDDVAYIWENEYDSVSQTCTMDITFFVKDGDGRYKRFTEQHCETGYDEQTVKELLEGSGFSVEAVYSENTFDSSNQATERAYFVARAR